MRPAEAASPARPARRLLLFVAGDEPNSIFARRNLGRLLESVEEGPVEVEVVDVLRDGSTALEHRVLVTPTLIQLRPAPRATVIGNLSDLRRVRAVLGIPEPEIPGGAPR